MGHHAVTQPVGIAGPLWRTAQWLGVAVTGVLLWGLLRYPEPSLNLLWNVAIPLLPAAFLINPALWRNVCPLATLNMVPNGLVGQKNLTVGWLAPVGLLGIALLVVLVPARRFVFNTDGTVLAIVIVAVVAAAVVLGTFTDMKAGFCNAICPVLPVERLYGQRPFVTVGNPRCVPCTLCTTRGCIDLGPTRSIPQTLGESRTSHRWLFTGYGAFAAAFPGFVLGYYLTSDGPLASAGLVYLTVAAGALVSYVLVSAAVRALGLRVSVMMPLLAGAAIGIYYWFAGPIIATGLGLGEYAGLVLRVVALTLVAAWLWRAGRQALGREPALQH